MYEYKTVRAGAPTLVQTGSDGEERSFPKYVGAEKLAENVQDQLKKASKDGWRLHSVIPTIHGASEFDTWGGGLGFASGGAGWSRTGTVLLIFEREKPPT